MSSLRGWAAVLCVAVSLCAHALLLVRDWAWGERRWAAVVARPLAVRTLAEASSIQAPNGRVGSGVSVGLSEPVPIEAPSAQPLLSLPNPAFAAELSALPHLPDLPALMSPAAAAGELGDEAGYIPRPRLSVVPVMQHSVVLQWPPEWAAEGLYSEVLSLFIDEYGIVQRVRVDGNGLPELFQHQARQAFLGVRFSPGQLNGRDVKSLIRIEVSFEARPQVRGKGSR
jgi:hypothetical protein